MSDYYSGKRSKNIFNPKSGEPFRLSRSKIDLFLECPRCFYLDRRLGVGRPPGFPFNLNSAVDALLKKEFDIHRVKNTAHPMMKAYGIQAVPFQHEKIDEWRDAMRRGICFLHRPTNFIVSGGIDDVWVDTHGRLIIVDYKSTSKKEEVNIDADWQISYKRQIEVYQWLFCKNGFEVSPTGYFVYCNGLTDREAFDGKLEFDVKLIPYTGSVEWIEPTLIEILACLNNSSSPKQATDCDYCNYRVLAQAEENVSNIK